MEKEDLSYYLKKQKMDKNDVSKYIVFDKLKDGYYRVKSFSLINVKGKQRVRVDLKKKNIFIILPLRLVKFVEFSEKKLHEWNQRDMIMHFSLELHEDLRVHFHDRVKKTRFCYECSKLQDATEFDIEHIEF